MAINPELGRLEKSPSELVPKRNPGNLNQNNPEFTTSDGRYEVYAIDGRPVDSGFDFQVTINSPEIPVPNEDYYRAVLDETKNYDGIKVEFTGAKLLGWFTDSRTDAESNTEPEPEYVSEALSAVNEDELSSRLKARKQFADMKKANIYVNSIIEEMKQIYKLFE